MAQNTTATDAPNRIEGGNFDGAILIGSEEGEPTYWNVSTDALVKPTGHNQHSQYQLSEETVGEYILESEREGHGWTFSAFGRFLRNAAPYGDVRVLTHRQAAVYGLRKIEGVGRNRAATLLGISENTVDNLLSTARKKVDGARAIAEAIDAVEEVNN